MTVDGLHQSAAIRDKLLCLNFILWKATRFLYPEASKDRLYAQTSPEGNIKSVSFNQLLACAIMPLG